MHTITTIRKNLKPAGLCLLPVVLALTVLSCGNAGSNTHSKKETAAASVADCPQVAPSVSCKDTSLNTQISSIFKTYLEIQAALTQDQGSTAAGAAKRLNELISHYPTATLPDSLKRAYETRAAGIASKANGIAQSNDVAQQRKAFETLSGYVSGLLSTFGTDKPVYETHCPMAFDDKGASWLSDKTEVRNPYFGDQMLECGEVIRVIKARH